MDDAAPLIRPYAEPDSASWLRCRVLAFLTTGYFDDVLTEKPRYESPSIELVATSDGAVVGILDLVIEGALATIETIATHPDHRRGGVASALLEQALREIPEEVTTVDAWTREDEAANQWYRARDFEETFRYLHVYASSDGELSSSIPSARTGLTPVRAFFHGSIEDEAACREDYGRVYVCRRYVRTLPRHP